ncbi:MAG: YbaB/EbfC family nucleoid-associated protein [Candidatus Omnitrophota bacterium]|nr:YbaB/EbfC family nucleoid-associated protein [Candidatus Omnitrophota bacterium]
MFDKMKAFLDMQKKMQELKRELDSTTFETASFDNLIKITMSASQEIRSVIVREDIKNVDKVNLEKAIKDVYNKALKHAQDIAALKMKAVTGLNLPGLM